MTTPEQPQRAGEGMWPPTRDLAYVYEDELARLRRIEAAARELATDHACLHEPEPPCPLAELRAALSETP